ncbi:MAG: hypothetical protein RLZ83_837 [Pseudomonadota bacterium]|jgi:alkylation response protein AidB-like acyl-CoA dehydrogenase
MDDDSITMFRDSARDYLTRTGQAARARSLEAEGRGLDREQWRDMAALGWFSMLIPEADGGLGLGLAEVCAIAAEAGRHGLPEPLVDAGVVPAALLAHLPASELRSRLMAGLQSGDLVMGLADQERAGVIGPSKPAELGCRCDALDGRSRLSGIKRFVRPAAEADGWIVTAQNDQGLGLYWVDADAAGLVVADTAGVDGLPIRTITLQEVECLPLAFGPDASIALNNAWSKGLIALAAELAGIARNALERTCEHLRTRVQFGRPIGSFQALQHRMVDALIQVELAEACLSEVTSWSPEESLPSRASRAKARCGHAAFEVTRLAVHLHGAIGTTNEFDIGLGLKRAMTLNARLGNPAAHRRRHFELSRSEYRFSTDPADAPTVASINGQGEDFRADQDWAAMPETTFRQLVRALFAAHYPEARRHMPYRQTWAESRDWYLTLARLGWLAPAWPREHGGMGLPPDKLIAYIEETEAWGVARPPDQGLVMVGPILMRFGTPEQRTRYLPAILAGEHIWTQGYSEPGAGSDLAAVRTEAVLDGDHFIVNGQKTWTTWGTDGTHMFMLVRTDKTVKKQAGISFLLVDLRSPGITVRPIRNIAGEQDFCEVFFDNVRVPADQLVGRINEGWTIAKALLGFERLFTGSPKHSRYTLNQVAKLARQRGLFDDAAFTARLAELEMDTLDLAAAYGSYAEAVKRGEAVPPGISMLKIWSTETFERLALLLMEAAEDYASLRDHSQTEEIDLHVVAPLFNAMNAKIFAGSNEIQRNILATSLLGLPNA